jgi:hypothetical protein
MDVQSVLERTHLHSAPPPQFVLQTHIRTAHGVVAATGSFAQHARYRAAVAEW